MGPKNQLPSEMSDEDFNRCLEHAMRDNRQREKMTKEEEDSFIKAMKKPEFTKLMKEYMDEISDPKNREEQEMYLRQLESDNKVPGDMQLLHPKPGYCIKVKPKIDSSSGDKEKDISKVFINVCHAGDIDKPKATTVKDPNNENSSGQNWSLPYSLGPLRYENDKSGQPQTTFDFCVHTDTLTMAMVQQNFKNMLTDTAVEAVRSRMNEIMKTNLTFNSNNSKVLKGVQCMGGKPAIMQHKKVSNNSNQKKQENQKPKTKEQKESKTDLTGELKEKNVKEPPYRITHRGQFEMSDYMEASIGAPTLRRPKELVIRIRLQKLSSAKGVDLDISSTYMKLKTDAKAKFEYELNLDLPYPVLDKKGSARFDKSTKTLEVILPVEPPPVTEVNITKEDKTKGGLVEVIPTVSPPSKDAYSPTNDEEQNPEQEETAQECTEKEDTDSDISVKRQESSDTFVEIEVDPMILEARKVAREITELPRAEDFVLVEKEKTITEGCEEKESVVKTKDDESLDLQENDLTEDSPFISCRNFQGRKAGYEFKLGNNGLGYYKTKDTVRNMGADSEEINSNDESNTEIISVEEKNETETPQLTSGKIENSLSSLNFQNNDIFLLD